MLLRSTIHSNLCRLSIVTNCLSCRIHLRVFSPGNTNSRKMGSTPSGSNTTSRWPSDSMQNKRQSAFALPDRNYDVEYPPLVARLAPSFKNGESNKRRMRNDLGLEQKTENVTSTQLEDSAVSNYVGQHDVSLSSTTFRNKGMKPIDLGPEQKTENVASTQLEDSPVSNFVGQHDVSSSSTPFRNKGMNPFNLGPEQKTENVASTQLEDSPVSNYVGHHDVSSPSTPFRNKGMKPGNVKASSTKQSYSKHEAGAKKCNSSEGSQNVQPFYICWSRRRNFRMEKENEYERTIDWTREGVLRPGMVLLKHYLTIREQIMIVRICQELGKGPGGFYQPGYNDGAKLRLHMMCLGLDWDPQTRKYGKERQADGSEPPVIPIEFIQMVQRSISEAHSLIRLDSEVSNVEDILPAFSPDLCIVNFYNTSGRLGLHQDRDESRDSLKKGIPVVSFSVGDSAEFLFGDERDVDKAEKVLLESGDILIFGGESRHVFHGVSSIHPNSAPGALLEKTMLRPGRLNLTFRKY